MDGKVEKSYYVFFPVYRVDVAIGLDIKTKF